MANDISVVVPVRNRADLLDRALRSVVGQKLQAREIVVVDDGSQYPIVDSLSEDLAPFVRYLRHEPGVNGAYARNRGIEAAQGDYVAFLDADDWWLPEHLECRSHELLSSSGDAVFGAYCAMGLFSRKNAERALHGPASEESIASYLFHSGGSVRTSTLLVRRQLALRVRFSEELAKHQDWDFALRIATVGRLIHSSKVTVCIDHAATARMSGGADVAASRLFIARNEAILGPCLRNAFRVRVARNALEVGDCRAARELLRDVRGTRRVRTALLRWAYGVLARSRRLTRIVVCAASMVDWPRRRVWHIG